MSATNSYPILRHWKVRVTLRTDPSVISPENVVRACALAGRNGIGAHHPKFGQFVCQDVRINGKPINQHE